ncbi:hypothetical protein ACI2K4_22430 [Micromonospora sp. NPDC050397]|uniref:hypothetical protein n=1 Tax=Micromonospora sp. NPDC050397 TaxID=3364279 RepID=UPI003850AE3C
MELQSIAGLGSWVVLAGVVGSALGVIFPVLGKIIIAALALRGADPKDRPSIIKAIAELFRWRR